MYLNFAKKERSKLCPQPLHLTNPAMQKRSVLPFDFNTQNPSTALPFNSEKCKPLDFGTIHTALHF